MAKKILADSDRLKKIIYKQKTIPLNRNGFFFILMKFYINASTAGDTTTCESIIDKVS